MEMVSTVANLRGMDEVDVVNKFTFRQAVHVGGTYLKDKMLVMTVVSKALGKIGSGAKEDTPATKRKRRGLPSWFTPKSGRYEVVDLDDDLGTVKAKVAEYMGAGPRR